MTDAFPTRPATNAAMRRVAFGALAFCVGLQGPMAVVAAKEPAADAKPKATLSVPVFAPKELPLGADGASFSPYRRPVATPSAPKARPARALNSST